MNIIGSALAYPNIMQSGESSKAHDKMGLQVTMYTQNGVQAHKYQNQSRSACANLGSQHSHFVFKYLKAAYDCNTEHKLLEGA